MFEAIDMRPRRQKRVKGTTLLESKHMSDGIWRATG
jgi:hypothetical protein